MLVVHLGGDSWKQSNTVENMVKENGEAHESSLMSRVFLEVTWTWLH